MSDLRERAIKDVADAGLKFIWTDTCAPGDEDYMDAVQYAVARQERVLQLEKALRDCMNNFNMTRLIMPEDTRHQVAELLSEYRAVLESK